MHLVHICKKGKKILFLAMAIETYDTEPKEGLRERKRRQTRQRIQQAGLRLFLERGFEETTLDAIAEAADIARRTFFHYFEGKEDILSSLQDDAEAVLTRSIQAAPADASPFDVVCDGILTMISGFGTQEARAIDRLLRSTETLRARKQANYEKQERMVCDVLCEKWPAAAMRVKLRLVSMVCIGAMRLAADLWSRNDSKRPLEDHLRGILATLRKDVTS